MDTILEALRALKEDFEIIPLTDKEKEEWKNRKELLTKLAEVEKGSSLEVTEDIIDIFKKALKEMEESGMPVGKVPNLKVTPLEDAVPTVGEDDKFEEIEEKEEITESTETKYLLGFSRNSLSGGKTPFVIFDDIKNYQESEEDGVKTFSFEDEDTRYKYIGNDETGYKEVDNRGPKMDSYRIVGRRTVKRNYPSTLDKGNRIGYKPINNPTWESLKELNESLNLNKDFYDKLPSFACEHLDNLISKYGEEDWFEDAWNKYRNHILSSDMEDMKMSGVFFGFNKHLDARTKGAIKKGWIDAETGKAINTPLNLKEDLIIVEADKVKDKLYALKDEIEKAEGNLKFFLMDLFAVYMYHAFWGGVPNSSDERDELKAKGISTDELIHSDLTRKEWDELAEWENGIDVEFKKE